VPPGWCGRHRLAEVGLWCRPPATVGSDARATTRWRGGAGIGDPRLYVDGRWRPPFTGRLGLLVGFIAHPGNRPVAPAEAAPFSFAGRLRAAGMVRWASSGDGCVGFTFGVQATGCHCRLPAGAAADDAAWPDGSPARVPRRPASTSQASSP
jgi:hypothetical protein